MAHKQQRGSERRRARSAAARQARQRSQSREYAVIRDATLAGYLGGEKSERVGGRVTRELLSAAKAKSGIQSQSELLEYALSKVALEDDYGPLLLSMKGSIPDDVAI